MDKLSERVCKTIDSARAHSDARVAAILNDFIDEIVQLEKKLNVSWSLMCDDCWQEIKNIGVASTESDKKNN